MPKEPACHLCSGVLVREEDVTIAVSGTSEEFYPLAWVCQSCGTAWPIGVKSAGIFKGWKPLWDNGVRSESE
jgi:hypothetical protein